MNQKIIDQIATQYMMAKHDPWNPSYAAFMSDTLRQFRYLLTVGYKFHLGNNPSPYKTSDAMFDAIEKREPFQIYKDGAPLAKNHVLSRQYFLNWDLTGNHIFRAVHDILGHYPSRAKFETFEGEIEAYENHKKLYSTAAIPALYSETIGQLCYYYSRKDFVPKQICAIIPVRQTWDILHKTKIPFVTEEEIWDDISNYILPNKRKNVLHLKTPNKRDSLEDKNRANFVTRVNQAIVVKKQEVLV